MNAPLSATGRYRRLLSALESDTHRRGWGQNPALVVLYEATAVDTDQLFRHILGKNPKLPAATRVDGLVAQQMLGEYVFGRAHRETGQEPWEVLRNMAINLAYAPEAPAPARMLETLRQPGVFGFAVVHEAFGVRPTDRQEAVAFARGDTPIERHPGAGDYRCVYAVTVGGDLSEVIRRRGERPEVEMDANRRRGDLSTSLRIIADAVAGRGAAGGGVHRPVPRPADAVSRPGFPVTGARAVWVFAESERMAAEWMRVNGVEEAKVFTRWRLPPPGRVACFDDRVVVLADHPNSPLYTAARLIAAQGAVSVETFAWAAPGRPPADAS